MGECHGGKVYPKECKSGAIWDSIENACVFPPNVPDCECYGGENTCFYSGPNNKVFIECNSGKKITIECPTDLVWDDIRKSCIVPTIVPDCVCPGGEESCYYAGIRENEFFE